MRNRITKLLLVAVLVTLNACGEKQEVKELGCGVEMSGYEVMDVKSLADKGYEYTEENRKLALEMAEAANKAIAAEDKVQIAFVKKDDTGIEAFVVGPSEIEQVEKISCMLMKNNFGNRLPDNRKFVFYTNDHNTLVAAVKTKKAEQ